MDLAAEPTLSSGTEASVSDTLKRKRASSPFLPSKRSHPQLSSDQTSPSTLNKQHEDENIKNLIRSPHFNPRILQGESAQAWRRFLVQDIFKNTRPTLNEQAALKDQTTYSGQEGLKIRPNSNDSSATEQGIGSSSIFNPMPRRVARPRGFDDQLPPFSLPYRKVTNTPETKPTLAYVVVGPRVRGKFDVEKAKVLKIPDRQRGQLTKGKVITFMVPDEADGGGMVERTVQPEEVVGPSESPSVVLVLDTPTLGHIPALTSSFIDSPFFAKFRSKRQEDISEYAVRVIFHQCGDGVLEDERYKIFMNGFGPDVYHAIASREHGQDPITFTSAAFNQMRLSRLDPDIFRLPKFRTNAKANIDSIPGLPDRKSVV